MPMRGIAAAMAMAQLRVPVCSLRIGSGNTLIRRASSKKCNWISMRGCRSHSITRRMAIEDEEPCSCPEPSKNEENSNASTSQSSSKEATTGMPSLPPSPSKTGNRIVAFVSAAAAVCLFLANRGLGVGPTLSELTANAIPYEEALRNGKPTVVEFYADWCEVCREMARDIYSVEEKYKDRVNFVMLNVDNTKWEAELDEFGVEGIPHFAFLDREGNEEGNIVGRLPKNYLTENVEALAKGLPSVPHSRAVGQFSDAQLRQAPRIVSPRAHG